MFQMVLGHLVGDYLLQNQWMALNKSKNTAIGWLAAWVHCIIYTAAVCTFMGNFELVWILVVFNTHIWIDKFALAEKYMIYIKGDGLKRYIDNVNWTSSTPPDDFTKGHQMLSGGFRAVVYTVTDNTIHLLLMWGAYQILY